MTDKQVKSTRPRKLQEIFDAVIDAGHYAECWDGVVRSDHFMCTSLDIALKTKIITDGEYYKASKAIAGYGQYLMNSCGKYHLSTLRNWLASNKLPCDFPARLAIYRNWEFRPRIKRKTPTKSS